MFAPTIANCDLLAGRRPPPDADWELIGRFALTSDGYGVFGDRCRALANQRAAGKLTPGDQTLSVLRGCLFFEQRRCRHVGEEPEGEDPRYLHALVEDIRAKVQGLETLPKGTRMAESNQRQFLRDQFHALTLAATMQRAGVYVAGLDESQRSPVHEGLRRTLDELAAGYSAAVSEEDHLAHIVHLAERMSREHEAVLNGGRFRIGPAQKALNLFLKYLWCSAEIPEPPHCPFDQRIIVLLPTPVRCNWTSLDDIAGYERLVEAARTLAGPLSLAEWELDAYNRVSIAGQRANR